MNADGVDRADGGDRADGADRAEGADQADGADGAKEAKAAADADGPDGTEGTKAAKAGDGAEGPKGADDPEGAGGADRADNGDGADRADGADGAEGAEGEGGGKAVAVEWKLDGIRAQIHVRDGEVRVFTRTLDEITSRLPEVVEAVRGLPVREAVFDGELIALRPDGSPHPFQVTAARTATRTRARDGAEPVPLSAFLFDVLHLDGDDLLDAPGAERDAALARAVPERLRMPRVVTADPAEAKALFDDAVARGHEGVLVKSLDTPYTAGRRGAGWIKVKPRHTLDLVVLAVEWGHGRRRGLLSNLHLGARDPEGGGFVMLGKTFKGLTDKLLAWQTEALRAIAVSEDDWTVRVRPELVVEIAFDGVQRSPRYPGGIALRFARVLRYRPDKSASEADTIDTVRAVAPLLDAPPDDPPDPPPT
ncbi:RNA ligase family protein [Actinomadura yumaensis]|uniref:ATP-dependent DNA ligase n=1 Tax=Actinomadura TaxID=1988 RepID=UPI0028164D4B|nr:RNA ligase family protein [Actinomadura sp. J1-007]